MEIILKYFPDLTEEQRKQFAALYDLYIDWNAKINVISRKDIENLYEHHVLHSLGIAKVIQFRPGTKVMDLGTGGGFPGIPLAILFPETKFHLVDSIGKKVRVATEVANAIGLKNVTFRHARAEEEKQALKKFILTNELTVKHLLNTHLHLDHIFGNPFMLKEFGLSAEANKADEFWIDEAPKQSRMFGFQLQEEPVPLGKYLHDGDIITFGHTKLEAIHVPGHSPGSLVYYCKEENCMFSGDVLFQGSIGRADLSGGNFDELIDHICSRLFVLPNETVVYPGHGAPTTIGMEKAENPFFR